MVLRGERCALRRWRTSDATAVAYHANNMNVAKHLRDRFPHPYTVDDAQAFLSFASKEDPQTNFAIDVGGEAAGGLGYVPGTDVERYSAEVGYWLGESCWGRGICDRGAADLHAIRLYGAAAPAPVRACRCRTIAPRSGCWKRPVSRSKGPSVRAA